MRDMNERIPCAVSQEMVNMVANRYPDKFKNSNGEIKVAQLLFALGFKIDMSMKNQGFYRNVDVLVRDNELPSKLYKTSCVYNGEVRNTINKILPNGVIQYSRRKHELSSLYTKWEVVQPKGLRSIIPEEEFQDILDVGDPNVYEKAFIIKDPKEEKKQKYKNNNIQLRN